MSFGGSVAAMIASLKANKRTRVSTFDKIKNHRKSTKTELHFNKKATPLELKKLREKLEKENNKVFKQKVTFLIIVIVILLYFLK